MNQAASQKVVKAPSAPGSRASKYGNPAEKFGRPKPKIVRNGSARGRADAEAGRRGSGYFSFRGGDEESGDGEEGKGEEPDGEWEWVGKVSA